MRQNKNLWIFKKIMLKNLSVTASIMRRNCSACVATCYSMDGWGLNPDEGIIFS
jgi:hypothetical protein